MGVLTLQNYRDDLGGSATQIGALQRTGISTNLLDRWVNQALREVGYAFKFHELEEVFSFNTVVGVSGYAITVTDLRNVEEVKGEDPVSGNLYRSCIVDSDTLENSIATRTSGMISSVWYGVGLLSLSWRSSLRVALAHLVRTTPRPLWRLDDGRRTG